MSGPEHIIYDKHYFDGALHGETHRAGWSFYEKTLPLTARHEAVIEEFQLENKKVLELGCATGFFIEDALEKNVDAWGIDVSSYARSKSKVADRIQLISCLDFEAYDGWDFVLSFRLLPCLTDSEIELLASKIPAAYHVVDDINTNAEWYNVKTLDEWIAFDWPEGTIIESFSTGERRVK